MTTRYVYLAGPITGLTYDEAADWRADITLPEGWVELSPMRGKEKFKLPGPLPSTFDEGGPAVQRDLSDIRRCSAVIVNVCGAAKVSLGTMAEMGYAYSLAKPIIVVMDPEEVFLVPIRDTEGGFIKTHNNPHDHVFVHEMASVICPTLPNAVWYLNDPDVLKVSVRSMAAVA